MLEIAGPWITEHELNIINDAMLNGWHGKDKYKYVELFENEFSKYHNRQYALMTTNCTSAIHLLLSGLKLTHQSEIIVPECTWIASSAPISYINARPVFADISPVHWCITAESLSKSITHNTKAAIIVDLYGNMPEWDQLIDVAEKNNIILIEDAAEALGSKYRNIRAGKFGTASVFSFHRTKTITSGEGGMLLLDDKQLYERCKFLRDHGRDDKILYYNTEVAFKYMPFNLQAALGYAQFQRIDELLEKKRWILKTYQKYLKEVSDIQFNNESIDVVNSAWCTTLVLGDSYTISKQTLINELNKHNLPSRPFFYPLSSLPAYKELEYYGKINLMAYYISSRGINLPSSYLITEDDIKHYTEILANILVQYQNN